MHGTNCRGACHPTHWLIYTGNVIQFERRGFYRVDVAFRPPICNNGKTTYPRLVYVPDGKPQHKVPFSRLPSAKK